MTNQKPVLSDAAGGPAAAPSDAREGAGGKEPGAGRGKAPGGPGGSAPAPLAASPVMRVRIDECIFRCKTAIFATKMYFRSEEMHLPFIVPAFFHPRLLEDAARRGAVQ